jgi:hypothetical protein
MEWRPPATEIVLPCRRAFWMMVRHSSMDPGTLISRTRAEFNCECTSFTRRPGGVLLAEGVAAVNFGGLATQPDRQAAAPDISPAWMNPRRVILVGERCFMLF